MFVDEPATPAVARWLLAVAAALVVVPLTVVLVVLGLVIGMGWITVPVAVVLAVAVGALLVWQRARTADARVLEAVGPVTAVPADSADERLARFRNLVDGLCLSIGVAEPTLAVIDDPAPNAMAVAAGDRHTVIVTRSVLEQLDRLALEGVVAELLIRLRNGDAERATLVAALFGGPLVEGPLAGPLRPLTAMVYDRAIDEHRDISADLQAVSVTRYPPGLRSGLEVIAGAATNETAPAKMGPGFDHLWIVPPGRARRLFDFAPLEWRIDVLLEI